MGDLNDQTPAMVQLRLCLDGIDTALDLEEGLELPRIRSKHFASRN